MENHSAAQPATSQLSLVSRAGWAILIVATLYVCYFSHLGAIGFVGPDEPRYAWIARDMAETGDWVTPRLYGKPWFEKPPLFYWEAALCFKLFGVSEAAARLPSAVSALLATLALAWLAWSMYGAETARWLLLLLPTTVGMIGFSHAAATDMPFSAMLTIAMVFAAVLLGLAPNLNQSPSLASFTSFTSFTYVFFGFFLGLAVLAKGPVGIVLCGGAVFMGALFTRRWRDAFRLLHPASVAAFSATALPWYILCARRNPDFFRIFIIEHNFKRYLTPEFQHVQPWWFYVPVLLVASLPWTGALVWTAVAASARIAKDWKPSPQGSFLLSWSLFAVVFFSISQSKLPGYLMPAVPAIALLMTRCCLIIGLEHRRFFGLTMVAFALLCFGISEFASRANLRLNMESQSLQPALSFLLIMIVLANVLLAVGFFSSARRVQNLMVSLGVLPILIALLIGHKLVSGLAPLSSRDLAEQLLAQHVPPQRTFIHCGMSKSLRYGLNFYLHNEVLDWDQNPSAEAYVVSGSLHCYRLEKEGFQCEDVLLGPAAFGWFVCHVRSKASTAGAPGSGQPH